MQNTLHRDTPCELAVRRLVHAAGLRYRVDHPLPFDRRRRADLLFTRAKVAVFIDGCFWHSCPVHGTLPRSNRPFWRTKLEKNRARDVDTIARLRELGWLGLRFWEHEEPGEVASQIEQEVLARAGS
jgi:DNA mismatch endonuclease (patch repair protein)